MDGIIGCIKNLKLRRVHAMLRKAYAIVAVLATVAIIATVAANIPSNGATVQRSERELKLVHVVMRHGIRAPVSTYPKDPHLGAKYEPNGWGQLTIDGIRELHSFGALLRERYSGFFGVKYNASEFYAQATGVDRAIASLMAVNAGLWPPVAAQAWSDSLPWFPIPVMSEPLDKDSLLLVRTDCPQYNMELKRVEALPEVRTKLETYTDLFAYVQASSGQKIANFYDIEDIYATLLSQQGYGLKLPQWTEDIFPDKMSVPAGMSFVLKAYNDKLQRLKGGVLLKKLLDDWLRKAAGALEGRKGFLYGGHDSTVANLLSALKVFDQRVPNYGAAVIFELSYDRDADRYGLEIFLRNSTEPLRQLQLPHCEKFCTLENVVKLTANVVPTDWEAECASDDPNYIPPTQTGP